VNVNHYIIAKLLEEEVNSPLKGEVGKQLAKKKNVIIFFSYQKSFLKDHVHQKLFYEDMGFLTIKNNLPM